MVKNPTPSDKIKGAPQNSKAEALLLLRPDAMTTSQSEVGRKWDLNHLRISRSKAVQLFMLCQHVQPTSSSVSNLSALKSRYIFPQDLQVSIGKNATPKATKSDRTGVMDPKVLRLDCCQNNTGEAARC